MTDFGYTGISANLRFRNRIKYLSVFLESWLNETAARLIKRVRRYVVFILIKSKCMQL